MAGAEGPIGYGVYGQGLLVFGINIGVTPGGELDRTAGPAAIRIVEEFSRVGLLD